MRIRSNPDKVRHNLRLLFALHLFDARKPGALNTPALNHSRYLDDEGWDRKDLRLPYGQDELIQRIVQANPRTILVLISGPAIEMDPWLAQVPAVLQAGYPGMEGGSAIARVLFGDVNLSGKITCTYPKRLADSPAHALDT